MLSKIFERLVLSSLFNCFLQTIRQLSGFIPGDSCVPHLLLITHEIATHQLI